MSRWLVAVVCGCLLLGCSDGTPGVVVQTVERVADATSTATVATGAPAATPTVALPTEPASTETTLVAAGDVMLARSVGVRVLEHGPEIVFAGVRQQLAGADIAFANVESAISDRGSATDKSYVFEAPPESVGALTDAGIDVVSQANNHALDFGPEALLDTRRRLMDAGIGVAGSGANEGEARSWATVERNGLTFAFLAYVDTAAEGTYTRANWDATGGRAGVAWASTERIAADVAAARATADVVVVSLHAGVEYSQTPSDLQRAYAEAAIDAGAALVIGTHPHVLQPVEEYGGGLIAYSLGNFVFDGFDGIANTTAILRVTFDGPKIVDWEMSPVSVIDGLPVLD